jgi:hypothetical protein
MITAVIPTFHKSAQGWNTVPVNMLSSSKPSRNNGLTPEVLIDVPNE